jgi:3-dehydroquinate synthase
VKTGSVSADPVIVSHALGYYPVYVEAGVLERLGTLVAQHLPGRRVAMIADATVHELYRAGRLGRASWTGETLTIAPGEKYKSRDSWARLSDELLKRRFGRDSGLISLGGGVTGDLAGFVAATYMRGIPYIQVPTTLLAMLDASVGGKTGVDTPLGKNLIGIFHPPAAVIADPQTLNTLPDRDYRGGLAEAVKHGLVADRSYFEWIEAEVPALTHRDPATVSRLVRRSVEIKSGVVSGDERESGRRSILNAGHTVAHALEQVSEYQLPHGEAVALGLIVECRLAEDLGIAAAGLSGRVASLVGRLGLPQRLPEPVDSTALLSSMAGDKKNRGGRIRVALASAVGYIHEGDGWTTSVAEDAMAKALSVIRSGPP